MISLRLLAITAALASFGVTGCALTPVAQDTQLPGAATTGNMSLLMGGPGAQMARMDQQIKAMQSMHNKMVEAESPADRDALMEEHMDVMQNSMAMMGEIGADRTMKKGNMGGMKAQRDMGEDSVGMANMPDMDPIDGDMSVQRQMMDKRMQMMQSMMQMMMDRMPPAKSKS